MLKDFNYYLRIERAMSQNTVASYSSDVDKFLKHYRGRIEDAGPADIEEYLSSRHNLSERSQARILSSLRSFFDWLVIEGLMKGNPCDRVDAPKIGRYLPEVLSEKEVEAIISSVDTECWMGKRDRAIIEVLYGCGLRVSETAGLKVSDMFLDEGFVRIVGKGNKERLVPVGVMAIEAVRGYMEARPVGSGCSSVFVNRFGNPLSRVSIFKMIKKQALAAGVRKEISPHTFRHSFATHLIEKGAELRAVQEMLGHESIITTEIYTHIETGTWHSNILDHHPRKFVSLQDTENKTTE